jgi:hypothetical protein
LGANDLLNEAIGFELATLLGVNSPQPALLSDGPSYLWMTEFIAGALHWHPHVRHLVDNLDSVGAMLALDVVVGNSDRHGGNILLQAVASGRLTAYSIDMEQSWAGSPDDIKSRQPDELPNIPAGFARLIPLTELETPMLAAAGRCQSWTKTQLGAIIQPWCNILGESNGPAIVDGILLRSSRAVRLSQLRVEQIRRAQ